MATTSATTARVERIAMGVTCVATVVGISSHDLAVDCLDLVEELESLWSRFIPTSDISQLNSANGQPTVVDRRTLTLIHHMIAAHQATDGAYNPTRLPLQIAEGDTHSLINNKSSEIPADSIVFSDLSGIQIFHTGDSIGWDIEILSPFDPEVILDTVRISVGGVATSSLFARQRTSAGITSHLFNNFSAHDTDHTVGATVIANSAAWSEAWTKHAILSNPAEAIDTLTQVGLAGMLVSADGHTTRTESWKTFTHD